MHAVAAVDGDDSVSLPAIVTTITTTADHCSVSVRAELSPIWQCLFFLSHVAVYRSHIDRDTHKSTPPRERSPLPLLLIAN